MTNSRHRALTPGVARSVAMKSPICSIGRAGWLRTRFVRLGADSNLSRLPRQEAGFTPSSRKPLTRAQSSIASIRPRKRDAVSVFVVQIGSSTSTTCARETCLTIRLPILGYTYSPNVLRHWSPCFAFFHSGALALMKRFAASSNVISNAWLARSRLAASFLARTGSVPPLISSRVACARARASFSDNPCGENEPSPISRRRPPTVARRIHDLAPVGDTCSARPATPPTACVPGTVSRDTASALSSFALRGMGNRNRRRKARGAGLGVRMCGKRAIENGTIERGKPTHQLTHQKLYDLFARETTDSDRLSL